jgi:hypothetical protein
MKDSEDRDSLLKELPPIMEYRIKPPMHRRDIKREDEEIRTSEELIEKRIHYYNTRITYFKKQLERVLLDLKVLQQMKGSKFYNKVDKSYATDFFV